jgi:hypothetical protein
MKKIVLAGLMALSFAVSSGLFSAANADTNGSRTGPYAQDIGNAG